MDMLFFCATFLSWSQAYTYLPFVYRGNLSPGAKSCSPDISVGLLGLSLPNTFLSHLPFWPCFSPSFTAGMCPQTLFTLLACLGIRWNMLRLAYLTKIKPICCTNVTLTLVSVPIFTAGLPRYWHVAPRRHENGSLTLARRDFNPPWNQVHRSDLACREMFSSAGDCLKRHGECHPFVSSPLQFFAVHRGRVGVLLHCSSFSLLPHLNASSFSPT